MSTRTLVRDRIVGEFNAMRNAQSGRVNVFDTDTHWLLDTETKRSATYCVVVTDEVRTASTLENDTYAMSGVVIIYAYDTTDTRAKLDLMIEDALDVLRLAFRALPGTIQRALVESVQVSEGSTAEGDWTQAVVRWSAVHERAFVV